MTKCSDDKFDFVSLSGYKANYAESWRKAYPDQKELKEVWFGPDKNKFRPSIKGFYCSCEINGKEKDSSKRRQLTQGTTSTEKMQ